jgi:hypothetical protein
MKELDKFIHSQCDFCNHEKSKPCLSCAKYLMFFAIKEAFQENMCGIDENIMRESIEEGVSKCFGYVRSEIMEDAIISGVALANGHIR